MHPTRCIQAAPLALALLVLSGCDAPDARPEPLAPADGPVTVDAPIPAIVPRPALWATPLEKPGLPNLHQVTPGLLRGAQPTAEGMRQLEAMGVKTVLSLRGFNDDDAPLAGTSLRKERIRFKTWHPEDEDVEKFLRIVTDPAKQPVFVHCQHGADRTGTMCAVYRMTVQGWTKDEAIREMTDGGYGFHAIWANLVTYLRTLDIPAMKKRAGLSDATFDRESVPATASPRAARGALLPSQPSRFFLGGRPEADVGGP